MEYVLAVVGNPENNSKKIVPKVPRKARGIKGLSLVEGASKAPREVNISIHIQRALGEKGPSRSGQYHQEHLRRGAKCHVMRKRHKN